MIKKIFFESYALAWTVGGVGLVLITMSGDTLRWGLWISGSSLALHTLGVIVDSRSKTE
mgnify:FL=1